MGTEEEWQTSTLRLATASEGKQQGRGSLKSRGGREMTAGSSQMSQFGNNNGMRFTMVRNGSTRRNWRRARMCKAADVLPCISRNTLQVFFLSDTETFFSDLFSYEPGLNSELGVP